MTPRPKCRLQYPVLLLHGMGGFDRIRIDLARYRAIRIDYFRGVAKALTEAGVPRVYTAPLPPTGAIRDRAEALRKFVKREVSERRFHLVAHSMGGLDSRDYITRLGGAGRAISLTTIGTPHRGTLIASLALESLLEPLHGLIGRLGARQALTRLHERTAAHRDLRPEDCARFNEATPDVPGVAYFSYGGAPPAEAVQWILRIPYRILLKSEGGGANDGLVPLASARWTGWKGELPADHFSQVGWQFTAAARRRFKPARFYRSILTNLASAEDLDNWENKG